MPPTTALAPGAPTHKEHRPAKNYVRTLEEYVVLSGVWGIPWYWGSQNFNQRNWDIKWDWPTWKRKAITFEYVRMDGDDFATNSFKHPFLSGTADFVVARTNHLAIPESFLLASLNSVMWEYLVEFREKPSVNDMITTPFAGMAIGEVVFQLGEFFNRGGDEPLNWALANTLGVLQNLHARMDNRAIHKSPGVDSFGFPLDRWHRFVLSAGLAHAWLPADQNETRAQIGLDTEIVTIRTWEKPGHVSHWVDDQGFSTLSIHGSWNEAGLQQGLIRVRATLGGYYDQDLEGSESTGLTGHAFFTGIHAAFEYSQSWIGVVHDRMAIMSLFGLDAMAMLHAGPLSVRVGLDAGPEFGMITALAGNDFVASLGPDGLTKTTLQQHNYYYSLGVGIVPSLHAELGPVFVGANARMQQFNSIDGLERNQAALTTDPHLIDRRAAYRVYAGLRPVPLFELSIGAEERVREGSVGNFRASLRERIVTAGAAFIL